LLSIIFSRIPPVDRPVRVRAHPRKGKLRKSAQPTGLVAAAGNNTIPNTPKWLPIDHFLLDILTA
jgi:hypothetical protein